MDTPLLPKKIGEKPKIVLLSLIVLTIVAVVVGIMLTIFELGRRPFFTPWIPAGFALFVILILTSLFYNWIRTDEDYDEPKYLYLFAIQFFALVVMGLALYAIVFPPKTTQFFFVGGVFDGVRGRGGEVELIKTGQKIQINRESCTPFQFKRVGFGTPISLKITQPGMSICSASGASGKVEGHMNKINLHCDPSWSIGGQVEGATNFGMIMNMNGEKLDIPGVQAPSQDFVFETRIRNQSQYVVTVIKPPTGATCGAVTNGKGTATGPVTNVKVRCVT